MRRNPLQDYRNSVHIDIHRLTPVIEGKSNSPTLLYKVAAIMLARYCLGDCLHTALNAA